jgi:hypothetical protein
MTMPEAARESRCLVCDTALSVAVDGVGARVCRRMSCQWTFRSTPAHRACAICRRPLAGRQLAEGVCSEPRCRREHDVLVQREHDARIARRRAARAARATALRDDRAPRLGIEHPEEFTPTPIPALARPITKLPIARRDSVRAHIASLAAEARRKIAAGDDSEDASDVRPAADPAAAMPPALSGLLAQGCARCRGECCSNGGNHAYIRVDAVARYLRAHPDKSDEAVVDDYAAFIGERSFKGSCVYHGPTGCTLPREMRSNICNTFYCLGLAELREKVENGAPACTFYFTTNVRGDISAAFVDAKDVRVVRRRATAPRPDGDDIIA